VAVAALAGPAAGNALATGMNIDPGVVVDEGNSGEKMMNFTVWLDGHIDTTVAHSADFSMMAGGPWFPNATPWVDYKPVSQRVTLLPGQTQTVVQVPIIGDTDVEPDETIAVQLTNPSPASDKVGPFTFGWGNVVGT